MSRTLPTTKGEMLTADEFELRWARNDPKVLAEYKGYGRVARPCTCDEYPEKHWGMARIEPDDPLPDMDIEWEPGDPAYGWNRAETYARRAEAEDPR